jgi:hypothetical protein
MQTTPQENKQLLSLLSSSFQRRLDDIHPPIEPAEPLHPAMAPVSGPAMDKPPVRAATHHLQSLLHHPLLARGTRHRVEAGLAAPQAAMMMEQAMFGGEADMDMVRRCMEIHMRTLQHSNISHESRLGRIIFAWFTSSNAETKDKFLASPECLRNAVPILYADGLEEVVWEWLAMLYSRKVDSGNAHAAEQHHVTAQLVRWVLQETHLVFLMIKEALRRSRLDAAVLQLVNTCAYMSSTRRMSSRIRSSPPWQASTRAVTMALLRRRHRHGLSVDLFDRFLEHQSSWSNADTFTSQLIYLYHPTRATAQELALAVSQPHDRVQACFDHIKAMSEPAQKVMLNALLDGAQLLLVAQDSTSERQAQLILDLVQEHFSNLADMKGDRTTQKRIRFFRQFLIPQHFVPSPVGAT